MKKIPLFLFVILLIVKLEASEVINTMCPVTPDEIVEVGLKIEYKGQNIGFCCKSCIRKFNKDPNEYLQNVDFDSSTKNEVENLYHQTEHIESMHEEVDTHTHSANNHEHNHLTDHKSGKSEILIFLGKLHVLSIHLPIALIPIAALLEGLGMYLKSEKLLNSARVNYIIGSISALVAVGLGWIAANNSNYPSELSNVLFWHRWIGICISSISIIGLFSLLKQTLQKSRTALVYYRIILSILSILVPVTAHLGGTLIYGKGYLF